ncbi:MAG: carbohydrate ABC transporter permease [Eubacteriales bacterium]|nr:carbohydrate ABC transporter permease [Eubacteriales bacterium]
MTKRKKHSVGFYTAFMLFVIVAVINVYPMVFSIFCSFKGNLEIFSSFTALPKRLRFENYVTAWEVGRIGRYFLNTIILAVGTLGISGLFGAMASYILSRFTFKGKSKMYLLFISGMMIPIQAVLIPLSYLFGKLGIMNNYPVLILLYAAFCFPMTILILTGFMNSIPTELEEAMVIDGASIYQVFYRMILPLSMPGIVSVSIFNFIQVWNNLLFPLIFISDKDKGTISMGLLAFFGEYSTDYSASMAGICLTTIPVIIAYVFFQDKIENGLMSGAIKG